jgi:replication-associated recombination protein RarA
VPISEWLPKEEWGASFGAPLKQRKEENNMAFNGKYNPTQLSDLVIEPDNLAILRLFENQSLKNHLLLEGTNGTGKTTITSLLPKLIHGDNHQVEEVWGHEDFVIDSVCVSMWDNIISFNSSQQIASYVVINEIDKIKRNLPLFWQWLDTRREQVTVIGTTNKFLAIDQAMRSRMKCLTLQPVRAIDMLPRALQIMKAENLAIDETYLLSELQAVERLGDVRKYMERLELVAIALGTGAISPQGIQVPAAPRTMKRVK